MRFNLHLLSTFVLLACSGCGLGFNIDRDLPEQTVPGSPLGGLLGGLFELPIAIEVNLEEETAARNTGPAKRVTLTSLKLHVTETAETEPGSDDLSFIDSVDVYISSSLPESNLEPQLIATLGKVQRGEREVAFDTFTEVNLKAYVEEGARLNTTAQGTAPPDEVTFAGAIRLRVEVFDK
jgi:hypothetical protein